MVKLPKRPVALARAKRRPGRCEGGAGMGGKGDMKAHLCEFKRDLQKDFPVEKVILFGSHARGGASKSSDADVIVVSSRFRNINFIQRAAMMYDYWTLDMPVDFLCYTPGEFRKRAKGITLVREALKDGLVI